MRKSNRSVDLFRSLLVLSMDAVVILVGTKIAYLDNMGAKLFGFDNPSDVIGKDILKFHYPEDREIVKERLIKIQRGENHPSRHIYSIKRRDGTRVEVEANSTAFQYKGKPAVITFARDITEQNIYKTRLEALHRYATELGKAKSIEEIVTRTFEAIELVFGFTQCGFGLVESDRIRFLHLRGLEKTKYFEMPIDGPGISVRTVKTGKTQRIPDTRLEKDYFKAVPEEQLMPLSEISIPVKIDEEVVAVIDLESANLNAFTEEDQKLLEILAEHSSSAISRVRRVETLQRLVEEKTAELRDADQLAAAGRISAMVAHDLRSPIQVIRNAATIIKMKPDLTDKMLATIEESCARADKMLESFRSDTRDAPLNIIAIDLGALIREVLEQSPPPEKVSVRLKIGNNLETVHLDAFRVRRVLENLLSNAVEAMKGEGILSISAEQKEGEVVVRVSDTGEGIPELELPKLFRTFYTMKPKGLGLGLAFCKRAVESQGGRITVESKPSKGTTFTFSIPQKSKT